MKIAVALARVVVKPAVNFLAKATILESLTSQLVVSTKYWAVLSPKYFSFKPLPTLLPDELIIILVLTGIEDGKLPLFP